MVLLKFQKHLHFIPSGVQLKLEIMSDAALKLQYSKLSLQQNTLVVKTA